MRKIKVAIVDDLDKIVDFFTTVVESESDMEVVGTANNGKNAVDMILDKKPDVVLTDINMETKVAGLDVIRKVKEKRKDIKFIVLTIHEEDELLFKAYSLGVMDYIVKTSSVVEIITSIRKAYKNQLSLRPEIAEKILLEFTKIKSQEETLYNVMEIISKLTNSELQILKAAYEGNSYRKIAKDRFVELVTIKGQVNKILKKFEMNRMKEVISILKKLEFFEKYNL